MTPFAEFGGAPGIDNADAFARACAQPGRVVLGPGFHRSSRPLRIERPVIFEGAGQGATTIHVATTEDAAVLVGSASARTFYPGFERLSLLGPEGPPIFPTLYVRNTTGLTLNRVHVELHNGVHLGRVGDGEAGACFSAHLEQITMVPHPAGQRAVLAMENVNGLYVNQSEISGNARQIGLAWVGSGAVTCDTAWFSGVLVKDCLTGLRAGSGTASNVKLNGVYLDKCQSVGIHLESLADRILYSWEFTDTWVFAEQYGMIVDTRAGGHIDVLRSAGLRIDQALRPLVVLGGSPESVRRLSLLGLDIDARRVPAGVPVVQLGGHVRRPEIVGRVLGAAVSGHAAWGPGIDGSGIALSAA